MKSNWRTIFKLAYPFDTTKGDINVEEDFKNFKTENGAELPNRAKYTGDKFPKQGDPAKEEVDAWKKQNKQFDKDKKVEDKGVEYGSPLMNEKSKREDVNDKIKDEGVYSNLIGAIPKKGWRNVLADMTLKQKPDGTLEVSVQDTPTQPEPIQNTQEQVPPVEGTEDQTKQASKDKVETWVIKKKGNLELIGKQCETHCGVAITSNGKEEIFYKEPRNGHQWNEVIPEGVWLTRFDEYAK